MYSPSSRPCWPWPRWGSAACGSRAASAARKLEDYCQASAARSLEEFQSYGGTGREEHYWYGAAAFNAFYTARQALLDTAGTEHTWCNSLYGAMVLAPETVQEHIDQLTAALSPLAADWTDPNGYLRISELDDQISHGE